MEGIILVNLPVELVIEILLRLPVQSLLRFKCVCKSWNKFTLSLLSRNDLSFEDLIVLPFNNDIDQDGLLWQPISCYCDGIICFIDLQGFGYDPKSHQYKVVRICNDGEDNDGFPDHFEVEVYTLGTDS
ncbi:hypothetical protein PTKIN_Ptkin08bG0055000 [Pterospermum kingtungense]